MDALLGIAVIKRIFARSTVNYIAAITGGKCVIPGTTRQAVVTIIAAQDIIARCATQVLNIAKFNAVRT